MATVANPWPCVQPETKLAQFSQVRPVGPYWRAPVALTNELTRTFTLESKPIEARIQYAGPSTTAYINGKKLVRNGYFRNVVAWDITADVVVGTNELRLVNEAKSDWATWVQGEIFMRMKEGTCRHVLAGEELPDSLKGANPKLPPYEGSIRLAYTDYRFPIRETAAVALDDGFRFDFEGAQRPEFPFEAQLVYRVNGNSRWTDRFVATEAMVTGTREKWSLTVKRPKPRFLDLGNAEVSLSAHALYRWDGVTKRAAVSIQRSADDPEFPAPVRASVVNVAGVPQIALNGTPKHLFACWPSHERPDFTVRFSSAPVNVATVGALRDRPWWPSADAYDFGVFDYVAEETARDQPGTYFVMDISVYPPADWLAANPDERAAEENGTPCTTHAKAYSLSSDKALSRMEQAVEAAIRYLEAAPYANRIIGYRINSGDTIEWLGWRWNASNRPLDFSPAEKAGFGGEIPTLENRTANLGSEILWEIRDHKAAVDYNRYISDRNAANLIRLCRKAKELVGGRKLVGTYYGYSMTMMSNGSEQNRAHYSLEKVIKSKAVDFLMSPQPYSVRNLGEPIGDMKPFATLAANGIVPIIEDDTRTSVSRRLPAGEEAQLQLATREQSVGIARRNLGFALCRRQIPYFINIIGGTEFDFPEFAVDSTLAKKVGERCLAEGTARHAQIAIVVSEESMKAMPRLSGFHGGSAEREQWYNGDGSVRTIMVGGAAMFYETFCHVYKRLAALGAPVDYLLAEDLADHPGDYNLYIFTNAFLVDSRFREAVAKLRKRGATMLWMSAPGYMNDGGNSLASMKDLTGFDFEKLSAPQCAAAIMNDGRTMCTHDVPVSPLFRVTGDVETLGRWKDGSIAVAAKGRDVFCGPFQTDHAFLRELASRAGVHIYSETEDPLEANDRLVVLHAATAGTKTIRLPEKAATIYDVFNRRVVATNTDVFTFEAALHSTAMFLIKPSEIR